MGAAMIGKAAMTRTIGAATRGTMGQLHSEELKSTKSTGCRPQSLTLEYSESAQLGAKFGK
jgi:hypothetical protein